MRHAPSGLLFSLLLYNTAVVLILTHARLAHGAYGLAFWPAILLHTTLTLWSLRALRPPKRR